ncbi:MULTISPECIES: DUF1993 domain-containing protein [Phenylobacterium]|uniref:DUF1993 domain-containing protein n=1 Tax=Phenylobacterium koreense TaxID=266125 RepID=A0ABV2EI39_9CAUL
MAISLYDVSVASFLQTLGGVAGFLDRGLAHCQDNGIDPNEIVQSRMCPDMFDFRFQVLSVANHSLGAIEGVRAGVFSPGGEHDAKTYEDLQKVIADTTAGLKALTPEEINTFEGKDVAFEFRGNRIPFVAENFLMSFSMPNLHFHATTAYDLLRSRGVPIGKRDYMGALRVKA